MLGFDFFFSTFSIFLVLPEVTTTFTANFRPEGRRQSMGRGCVFLGGSGGDSRALVLLIFFGMEE